MTVFQNLIETVRKSNPNLITEQQANELSQQFQAQQEQIRLHALQDGKSIGFDQGYKQGKQVAEQIAKTKFQQMIAKLDQESTEKLSQIVDMLDEDHAKKLNEIYQLLKQEKEDAVNAALQKQDAQYAEKFETAIDAIDDNHSKKLQNFYDTIDAKHADMIEQAVNMIDEKHTKQLRDYAKLCKETKNKEIKLISESLNKKHKLELKKNNILWESKLNKEKDRKLNILAQAVEKYINYALQDKIPTKNLVSQAKYNAAIKSINKIIDILKVNQIIQESKQGLFADYQCKLNSEKQNNNKLMNENIQLKNSLNKKEAQLVLEEKCKNCTPNEAKFLKLYFKNASSPSIIEESINEAHTAYTKLQSERRKTLVEESSKNMVSRPEITVSNLKKKESVKKQIVSEQKAVENNQLDIVDRYVKMLVK